MGLLVILLLCVAGCGYSMRSLAPGGARTVAVEILDNETFRRDLEFQLTQELKEAILSRTNLRIVEKKRADLVLAGSIVGVREQVLSEDRFDDTLESSVVVTVDFKITNGRTGETLKEGRLTDRAEFLIGRGEGLNSATAESFADLSERVIYRFLEEPF